jgi:hypothetical protein
MGTPMRMMWMDGDAWMGMLMILCVSYSVKPEAQSMANALAIAVQALTLRLLARLSIFRL